MSDWIPVADDLPPIKERFTDVNFHGEVEGWFPYFYKHNSRRAALWTSDEGDRWMLNTGEGYGPAKEAPTHWRPYPDPPETPEKGQTNE